ncbi:MAG TPA: SWIM zinc finger family protein [bacterium]|mgnify:CR=1 FL=1|nr:SWIM zinc finger family protein [bacterium]HQL62363.1 SWIM zinc finger family protein [bacterium]
MSKRRRRYREFDYDYFPPAREAKGGIKAQTKRGAFAESWWAKRWIEVLESFQIGERLSRGRSYARRGQVLSIEIGKGRVEAKVQGSRVQPYFVEITVKALSDEEWKSLVEAFSRQPIFAAKLAAGEMPREIESVFDEMKLTLFPSRFKDLSTECSCPDWSNPCKHIAAVFYLLGEEFDRDPFLIFKMRGLSREEMLVQLSTGHQEPTEPEIEEPEEISVPPEPLPMDPDLFWKTEKPTEDFFGEVHIPTVPAGVVKQLGNFPFWRGEIRLMDAMEFFYKQASDMGLNAFLGEWEKE